MKWLRVHRQLVTDPGSWFAVDHDIRGTTDHRRGRIAFMVQAQIA
ncbi:MAG: hypothetical protein SVX28_03585 [Pseudomonadota bacterium]|nr:hypothetical protein [Pseudomonadota bacterium]